MKNAEAEVVIFVYGSLRSGQRNRKFIQPVEIKAASCKKASHQLSLCRTVASFAMVSLHSQEYPFLLKAFHNIHQFSSRPIAYDPSARQTFFLSSRRITGELFRLPKSKLPELDDFEGNEYSREVIQVEQNGDIYSSYAYVMSSNEASKVCENYVGKEISPSSYYRPVSCGDWDAYLHTYLLSQLLIIAVLDSVDNNSLSIASQPLPHSLWLYKMIQGIQESGNVISSVAEKVTAALSANNDSLFSYLKSLQTCKTASRSALQHLYSCGNDVHVRFLMMHIILCNNFFYSGLL